jgi:hypothetical protein
MEENAAEQQGFVARVEHRVAVQQPPLMNAARDGHDQLQREPRADFVNRALLHEQKANEQRREHAADHGVARTRAEQTHLLVEQQLLQGRVVNRMRGGLRNLCGGHVTKLMR